MDNPHRKYVCYRVHVRTGIKFQGMNRIYKPEQIADLYGVDHKECYFFNGRSKIYMTKVDHLIELPYRWQNDYKEHLKTLKTQRLLNG